MDVDNKYQAGLNKKSFELSYNGGSIWAEHLDSMGNYETEVIQKFSEDYKLFCKPSVSSFLIINLCETTITNQIANYIVDSILNCNKRLMKIAFVGVERKLQSHFSKIMDIKGIQICFMKDYEKAKQWILP